MQIKYFNSNFDKITQNKDIDQSITNVIEKLPSLNIVSDKNLLVETIKISNQFKEKKEKIIVFGTGGSNLGARALNNIILNNKIILEFYDNVDPTNFEKNFQNINFESDFFAIEGHFEKKGKTEKIICGLKKGEKKIIKRNNIKYKKNYDKIGLIQTVMISP